MELIGNIICGWLLADFLSGLFHWLEDRYLPTHWPIIGPQIVLPNIIHHDNPSDFLRGSYWFRNYTTIIPAVAAAVITYFVGGPTYLLLGFLFLTQANEIHAWAHRPRIQLTFSTPGILISLLQETGILQDKQHHAYHHTDPYRIRYCILSCWLNPWLDTLRIWELAERILSWFKIYPRR